MADAEEVVVPENWSSEDKEWLEQHVNPLYHKLAIKHGRLMFCLVLQAGLIGEALRIIQSNSAYIGGRKNAEIQQAIQILLVQTNDLHQGRMKDNAITKEMFYEAKKEIETLGSLAQSTPAPGRIVIAH